MPFQVCTNKCHHMRSERKFFERRVKKDRWRRRAASLYILATNVRPGFTTFVACCNRPTRDSISLFVAFRFLSQVASRLRILCSLSAGRRAIISWVSKVMPRNVRLWEGPSTFSRASGMPRVEHTSLIMVRLRAHVEDPGGPSIKKSSS